MMLPRFNPPALGAGLLLEGALEAVGVGSSSSSSKSAALGWAGAAEAAAAWLAAEVCGGRDFDGDDTPCRCQSCQSRAKLNAVLPRSLILHHWLLYLPCSRDAQTSCKLGLVCESNFCKPTHRPWDHDSRDKTSDDEPCCSCIALVSPEDMRQVSGTEGWQGLK